MLFMGASKRMKKGPGRDKQENISERMQRRGGKPKERIGDFNKSPNTAENGAKATRCFQTHIRSLVWQLALWLLLWRMTPHFIFHHDDTVSEGFPR